MSAPQYLHCGPAALFETVGGSRATFLMLVDIFKRDTADKLAKIRQGSVQGDQGQLAFDIHALKGTVGPTGADGLLEELVRLEAACRNHEAVWDDATLSALEQNVAQIVQELERFAATLQDS